MKQRHSLLGATLLLGIGLAIVITVGLGAMQEAGASLDSTALNTTVVSILPQTQVAGQGYPFTITVAISNVQNLAGFQFDLRYDPASLQVNDAGPGPFLDSTGRTVSALGPQIDNQAGRLRYGAFSFGSQAGPDGDGSLAVVTMTAQVLGSTVLTVEKVYLSDALANPLTATVQGGNVVVESWTPTPTPTATNTPTPSNTPTAMSTPTSTPAAASTGTATSTPTHAPTGTPTATTVNTPIPPTETATPGGPTPTPTATITPGGPTLTPSVTATPVGPTATPTPFPSPTVTVIPPAGGVVTSTGRTTTTVVFPPAAVNRPVTVTLALTDTGPVSGTLRGVGNAFAITAQTADGQPVTHFSQTITITVHYNDADVAGMNELDLKIYYWDVANGVWVPLPTAVDPVANILVATLDHLTKFGVFGPAERRIYLPVVYLLKEAGEKSNFSGNLRQFHLSF